MIMILKLPLTTSLKKLLTWFNRIIALRFMEVNNYLPSRVRVLTSEEGKAEPDIVDEAMEIEDDLGGYSDQEKS